MLHAGIAAAGGLLAMVFGPRLTRMLASDSPPSDIAPLRQLVAE
jgi:hypothetical protein